MSDPPQEIELIPGIDIKEGRCVRMSGDDEENTVVYSDDPVSVAAGFASMGAERLHVVDLDAALDRHNTNMGLLKEISASCEIPLQVGGGVRTRQQFEKRIELGFDRVVLGTAAIESPELVEELARLYPQQLVVGVDAAEGFVKTHGWQQPTETRAVDLAREMHEIGVRRFIHTDIIRDGTLKGVNYDLLTEFCEAVPESRVLVSGGLAGEEDLRMLVECGLDNLSGVIVGTALYEGALSFPSARKILAGEG